MTVTRNYTRQGQNISVSENAYIQHSNDDYSVNQSLVTKYKSALRESQKITNKKTRKKRETLTVSLPEIENKQQPSVGLDSAVKAPCCNTGGRYFNNNLSFVDWLRATSGDDENFQNFVFDFLKLTKGAGIKVIQTDKGMFGYKRKDELVIQMDGEVKLFGYLLTDNHNNEGGLFELNGSGCELLRIHYPEYWVQLHGLLLEYSFKFTRLDIALDFHSEYALEKGYTVPSIAYAGIESGLFDKDTQKGSQGLNYSDVGQWGELVIKCVTAFSYDPLEHADKGLTCYFGNRKSSPDYFRAYEKGKQLDSNLPAGSEERAYFRIEQEMKNPKGERPIPLDAMLNPDSYFAEGRSNLRGLLDEVREYYKLDDVAELHRSTIKKQKVRQLSKKVEWLKSSGGRVIKTLKDKGLEDSEIIKWLVRPEGLKDFVNDLDADTDVYNALNSLIISGIVPDKPKSTSDRIILDVSQAESGEWIANRVPPVMGS